LRKKRKPEKEERTEKEEKTWSKNLVALEFPEKKIGHRKNYHRYEESRGGPIET